MRTTNAAGDGPERLSSATEKPVRVGSHDLDHWRNAVGAAFGPLEPALVDHRPFRAVLREAKVGPLPFLSVRGNAHGVVRTARADQAASPALHKILIQISGVGVLTQNGRECQLRPGDLALSDTTRPYSLYFREDYQLSVLMFPPRMLPVPASLLERFTARVLPTHDGAGAVLHSYVRTLQTHVEECGDETRRRLGTACMDLLAAALTQLDDSPEATPAAARRLQIMHWIRDHLGDEDLTPATVAAAHNISPRYLHRLFQGQDVSVAAYIRHQRLEHVKKDLENPLFLSYGVSAVAARWGFHDQPHLTRLFRQEFGMPPGQIRRRAVGRQ
ncbi:helix-turn-helix domain-containing protein [Frankia sp. Cr1]|uniref:AraC-like ligand-binding domain-containing protein n=1 Tax=Frankia sp. Cr1 TaxID=3073931 RepID=UPI002AD28EB9|nr:helix-turn-helix domain-containing protein [Frankia sp. Cr1]